MTCFSVKPAPLANREFSKLPPALWEGSMSTVERRITNGPSDPACIETGFGTIMGSCGCVVAAAEERIKARAKLTTLAFYTSRHLERLK